MFGNKQPPKHPKHLKTTQQNLIFTTKKTPSNPASYRCLEEPVQRSRHWPQFLAKSPSICCQTLIPWHNMQNFICACNTIEFRELENDGIACVATNTPNKILQKEFTHPTSRYLQPPFVSENRIFFAESTVTSSRCIDHFADHVMKGLPRRSQRTQMMHGTLVGQPWRSLNRWKCVESESIHENKTHHVL